MPDMRSLGELQTGMPNCFFAAKTGYRRVRFLRHVFIRQVVCLFANRTCVCL